MAALLLILLALVSTAVAADPSLPALPAAPPPAVGILLPLSGPYRSFGEPCLRGARLALRAFGNETPFLRTVVLDTQGNAAETAAAFRKLAADPGVTAVLGPMLASELDAVRPYLTSTDLPVVTFSQRLLPAGGSWFRFSMTREDQARVLARYAVVERNLKRWAILHPGDSFGHDLAALFREQIESLGGRVLADVAYESGKTDFQSEVQQLRSHIGLVEGEPPPIDGVFLPDSADRIVLLAPHLAFADIQGVQLLGASGWNRPETLLKALPYVEGAVFTDGFFLHSFLPEVRSFVDAYRDVYRADPGVLEAYGYDAADLVKDAILGGAMDRKSLRAKLRQPQVRTGATGWTTITGNGSLEKSLFLLKVEEGTVREVEAREAPAAVAEPSFPERSREGWPRPDWDSRSLDRDGDVPVLVPEDHR